MRRSAARLNGRQRRALVLREVEGRSYPEIADRMGISTDAVAHVAGPGADAAAQRVPPRAEPGGCRRRLRAGSRRVVGLPRRSGLGRAHDEVTAHLATCDGLPRVLANYREASIQLRGAAPLSPLAALLERAGALFQGDLPPHERDRGDGRRQRRDRRRGRRRTSHRPPLRRTAAGRERRCRCAGRDHDRRSGRLPLAQRCDRVRRCRCSGRDVGDLRATRR